ncbi:DNA cytosine methyltransferase [Lysobacter capsici]|uniref:DNA cytosine methyltransferase n=1 Tax=Lysobacter capsici TaxID=435897 RepID=UPI001C00345D|nr:DNA (cytosine-5-)-methyltransferase [Lysobacter capsici]QWF19112.1 DNA (cytosine-5-)-methyltransferase [Lysobacter capsici]
MSRTSGGETKRSPAKPSAPSKKPTVAGLFAGVGGLEAGFHEAGYEAALLCEIDAAARKVLESRFAGTDVVGDVRTIKRLPPCTVLTAGFPCQDLSQVGRRKGITGPNSGLVHVLLDLLKIRRDAPEWVVIENVPFMLNLHGGRAIRFIADELESMGYSWAYRTIDAQAFGLPQRRRRVVLIASRDHDPRPALLGQDAGAPEKKPRGSHACGFYWTEGNTGLGWAIDAVPPLKGGSALHIPSPPAVWFPQRRLIAMPSIEDAERLQGFKAGWTLSTGDATRESRGQRWRMVGNAVSVPMAKWIAGRLSKSHGTYDDCGAMLAETGGWPSAAWSVGKKRRSADVSEWPVSVQRKHLAGFLEHQVIPLSKRATTGFLFRLKRSSLRYEEQFANDLAHHAKNAD